jgi:hypothetical protein
MKSPPVRRSQKSPKRRTCACYSTDPSILINQFSLTDTFCISCHAQYAPDHFWDSNQSRFRGKLEDLTGTSNIHDHDLHCHDLHDLFLHLHSISSYLPRFDSDRAVSCSLGPCADGHSRSSIHDLHHFLQVPLNYFFRLGRLTWFLLYGYRSMYCRLACGDTRFWLALGCFLLENPYLGRFGAKQRFSYVAFKCG